MIIIYDQPLQAHCTYMFQSMHISIHIHTHKGAKGTDLGIDTAVMCLSACTSQNTYTHTGVNYTDLGIDATLMCLNGTYIHAPTQTWIHILTHTHTQNE